MAKGKSTRGRRHAPRSKSNDGLAPPAERLGYILRAYQEHAHLLPPNSLVAAKTPLQTLAACSQLVRFLAWITSGTTNGGSDPIFSMLVDALDSVQTRLMPLFEAAEQAAQEARP